MKFVLVLLLAISLLQLASLFTQHPKHAKRPVLAVASSLSPWVERQIANSGDLEPLAQIHLVSGSSGTLYYQLARGAPYDAIVFADQNWIQRAQTLPDVQQPSHTQCIAQVPVALWAPNSALQPGELATILRTNPTNTAPDALQRMALPDPQTAPAGKAALELVEYLKLPFDPSQLLYAGSAIQTARLALTTTISLTILPIPLIQIAAETHQIQGVILEADSNTCCQVTYHALALNTTGIELLTALQKRVHADQQYRLTPCQHIDR
ncbi:MAG: substrate-binding domain-containing protein [Gammaproteobacteria bacterium]